MSSNEERQYIEQVLLPELRERFAGWAGEYQQERDLGMRGEFANLYRKTRKLKTVVWDGADPSNWREDVRTITMEVAAHAFLMLVDLDKASGRVVGCGEGHNHEDVDRLCEHPGCWWNKNVVQHDSTVFQEVGQEHGF